MTQHAASGRAPLLAVERLGKSFGGIRALNDVSFTVAAGEMLALIGPNGAGKSTCFNLINGQLKPDAGRMLFDGKSLGDSSPRAIWRAGISRTFQVAATFATLSVIENVQMALLSRRRQHFSLARRTLRGHHEQAMHLLTQVGMQQHATLSCGALSYGDIKRVELALVLANAPWLLLMDEPTAGMAPAERQLLMSLVKQLSIERQMGVLFTEHSMDVVFDHADRIVVLARGEIIASGDADHIRRDATVQQVYFGGGSTFAANPSEASRS